MANPQLENGYARIAHEITERLALALLNGSQHAIIQAVIRQTYGFQRASDHISLSQFRLRTGLNDKTIRVELARLKRWSILTEYEPPSFRKPALLGLEKDWEKWGCGFRDPGSIDPERVNAPGPGETPPTDRVNRPVVDRVNRPPTKDRIKDNSKDRESGSADADPPAPAEEILEHWQGYENLHSHRGVTGGIRKAVAARLRDYTVDQIKSAITIYAIVRNNPDKYWSHHWTLPEFLSRKEGKWVSLCLDPDWPEKWKPFERLRDPPAPSRPVDWMVGMSKEQKDAWLRQEALRR